MGVPEHFRCYLQWSAAGGVLNHSYSSAGEFKWQPALLLTQLQYLSCCNDSWQVKGAYAVEIHFIVFYHLSSLINTGLEGGLGSFGDILILFWLIAVWRTRVYLHVKNSVGRSFHLKILYVFHLKAVPPYLSEPWSLWELSLRKECSTDFFRSQWPNCYGMGKGQSALPRNLFN